MTMQLVGYEFKSQNQADKDFADYVSQGGWAAEDPVPPPAAATPVYADENGNRFLALPHEDGVVAMPFIPGSPAEVNDGGVGQSGGFVPVEQMPFGGGRSGFEDMMEGMASTLPPQLAADWVGKAAENMILGAGPGGMTDAALSALGVENPLASGPVAAVLGGALEQAGGGELKSLLPSAGEALMGGTEGLADAMGLQAINSLLEAAGLDQIPGASMAAKYLGGELGDVLQDTFTEGLDGLADSLSGLSDISMDGLVADATGFDVDVFQITEVDRVDDRRVFQVQRFQL